LQFTPEQIGLVATGNWPARAVGALLFGYLTRPLGRQQICSSSNTPLCT